MALWRGGIKHRRLLQIRFIHLERRRWRSKRFPSFLVQCLVQSIKWYFVVYNATQRIYIPWLFVFTLQKHTLGERSWFSQRPWTVVMDWNAHFIKFLALIPETDTPPPTKSKAERSHHAAPVLRSAPRTAEHSSEDVANGVSFAATFTLRFIAAVC